MLRIKDKTAIIEAVLGPIYQLSVAWVSSQESRRLNRLYRDHDRPTNILSFPLSPSEGEIILNQEQIEREAKQLKQSASEYTTRLFIHGVLHLKGLRHGSTMNTIEQQLFRRFFYYVKNHRHRTRHRHVQHSPRRLRTH